MQIHLLPVYGFISTLIMHVQAYVQCGLKLCHGNTAQCCSWDENECCWLSWYTLWWIWVAAIVFMAVIFSVVVCCFSKRRRKSSVRHMIIVPPLNHYNYGSIPNTPATEQLPFKYEMRSQLSVKICGIRLGGLHVIALGIIENMSIAYCRSVWVRQISNELN